MGIVESMISYVKPPEMCQKQHGWGVIPRVRWGDEGECRDSLEN